MVIPQSSAPVESPPRVWPGDAVVVAGGGGETPDTVAPPPGPRPTTSAKFLSRGGRTLYLRGATYGTFSPNAGGPDGYPDAARVDADFAAMAANGLNALRTYTVPPRWLLDTAARHGLVVLVGLPWEQHVAFLDDDDRVRSIQERVRLGARACAGHPALLGFAIGNEIPASIVRWHGARRVERFLERLYRTVKAEDPEALVTYVNYPSTEYLRLPFLDFVAFNVYLESEAALAAYLARLQNLAGERPLVLAEVGLDSRRNGVEGQANALDWQVRSAFAAGCAGVFVFAWTDEWHRGGYDVDDWDFGLVDRARRPKPALARVRRAFAEAPFPPAPRPRVSVVVCSYNGGRTIRDCLEGLQRLAYPNYEVIVVNDGSTDATGSIAREYPVRLIETPNGGLSRARNLGLQAATGEFVAYIDDDAYPDPHWLDYLVAAFESGDYAAVGGPNIPPPGDGMIAECVASAPGGPVPVLLTDRVAEHIPGCNMAFRATDLAAIGGFDPRFRTAGDDVDVCWRLHERGQVIGYHPAAFVWHHRRNSVRAYWRQQVGYGKAEALLEAKWPARYNAAGHTSWGGRLYGAGLPRVLGRRTERIYHGVWGSSLFQSLYEPPPDLPGMLPSLPEWYLGLAVLAALAALGVFWPPLALAAVLLVLGLAASLTQAALSAAHTRFPGPPLGRRARLARRLLVAELYLVQPLARLRGRMQHGLRPWRRRGAPAEAPPPPLARTRSIWSEQWRSPDEWLRLVHGALVSRGVPARNGGVHDRWDLEARSGLLGSARLLVATEDHGGGRQLLRSRIEPVYRRRGLVPTLAAAGLAAVAGAAHAWLPGLVLLAGAVAVLRHMLGDCAAAVAALDASLRQVAQAASGERAAASPPGERAAASPPGEQAPVGAPDERSAPGRKPVDGGTWGAPDR